MNHDYEDNMLVDQNNYTLITQSQNDENEAESIAK